MTAAQYPNAPVLLVDDEQAWLRTFRMTLRAAGITNTLCCDDSTTVMALLETQEITAVSLDLTMPGLSGEELLAMIVREHPEIPVLIVTGANQVESAVRCMKAGAFDYSVKTEEASRLVAGLRRAVELRELRRHVDSLKESLFAGKLQHPEAFAEFVTRDKGMIGLFRYVETVAATTQPVLITGESGVGKELLARAVHRLSGREGELVAVNVAGLDDTMFADTLFGHRKGAFTGAVDQREGLIAKAARGTLFLDEIGDLSGQSQVKLLRLLQEREYAPLGSDVTKQTDARVVVATNRDIHWLRKAGEFRRDLYYRLSTHHVHLPPLRERAEDLPLLLDHFLEEAATALGKTKPTPPRELLFLLRAHRFPGNVRELEAMVFDAVSHHTARKLSMDRFRAHILDRGESTTPVPMGGEQADELNAIGFPDPLPTLREAADQLVAEALSRAEGNQAIAARMLGISRQALNRRLRRE